MDGPERGIGSEGSVVDYFVLSLPLPLSLPLSSVRGESGGTGVRGCVSTFTFAFAFVFALSFPFAFVL